MLLWGSVALFIIVAIAFLTWEVITFPSALIPSMDEQPHQPDQVMLSFFSSHRQEFELLRSMAHHDQGLLRVDVDWTDPPDPTSIGVSQARISEYRRLFKALGIARGMSRFHDEQIEFIASSQGYVVHGSSKGYVALSKPPPVLLTDLDSMSMDQRPRGSGWRHIVDDWYLRFEGD